jgi:hypothetical protein
VGAPAYDAIYQALQLAIGFVFLLAVVPKILHPLRFSDTIANYQLLHSKAVRPAAFGLIAIESGLALTLTAGLALAVALPLAAATLVAFVLALSVTLHRRRSITCGCFGHPDERVTTRSLIRVFLLLCAIIFLRASSSSPIEIAETTQHWSTWSVHLLEVSSLSVFVLAAGAWLLSVRELTRIIGSVLGLQHRAGGEPS